MYPFIKTSSNTALEIFTTFNTYVIYICIYPYFKINPQNPMDAFPKLWTCHLMTHVPVAEDGSTMVIQVPD